MPRMTSLVLILALFLSGGIGYFSGTRHLLAPAETAAARAACVTFSETGKQVCDRFLEYWQEHGGLAQQGLPLTDVFDEVNPTNGKVYKTQYFERARFELHPENAPPYDVLLGLVGREQLCAKYAGCNPTGGAQPSPSPSQSPAAWPRTAANSTFRLTVHEVADNVTGNSSYFVPKPGMRWFAVDVSITNLTPEPLYYNPLRGSLKTTDNREWDQPIGGKEPGLQYGDQPPGSTVRGWITFEIANGAVPMTITYNPKFDGKTQLSIDLR